MEFVLSRSDAIAWRLHCIVRLCKQFGSTTAIAVTDRSFT